MSGWFDAKSITSLAKSALSQAQKQLDKALEVVADEDSDSDGNPDVFGLDPFSTTGWAIRKPKLKKDLKISGSGSNHDLSDSELTHHLGVAPVTSQIINCPPDTDLSSVKNDVQIVKKNVVVTRQIKEDPDRPHIEVNPVTSQVKASLDAIVGPVTMQVKSSKLCDPETEEKMTAYDFSKETERQAALGNNKESNVNSCSTPEALEVTPTLVRDSSESVQSTLHSTDLDFSLLEDVKDGATLHSFQMPDTNAKCDSTSGHHRSNSSGGGSAGSGGGAFSAVTDGVETAASSDIEIISAINSTPSEAALQHDQAALLESDALTDALRQLTGEATPASNATVAMETVLLAREQKLAVLVAENARLIDENDKLRDRIAHLEARNLEACRNSSEQVQQLLSEGDKLAREIVDKTNALKRLRTRERDQDELVRRHVRTIDDLNVQADRLRRSLAQKDAQEKLHIEQIRDLKAAKIAAADFHEQLIEARKRCDTLERENAKIVMESRVMTASAEMSAQDQLRANLSELKARHAAELDSVRDRARQYESLLKNAEAALSQNEKHSSGLRDQVLALQERNQELTESLASTTAPYIREVERMRTAADIERKSFESEIKNIRKLADSLQQKLSVTEEKLSYTLKEKDSCIVERQELVSLVAILEKDLQEAKMVTRPSKEVKHSLCEYVEILKSQLIEREDAITKMHQTIELLKSRETSLEQKILTLEQSVEFERQKNRLESGNDTRSTTPTIVNRSSLGSSLDFEKNDNYAIFAANPNSPSVLDNMSSQLKLKDGQMQQLRSELSQLKRSRDLMSNQMAEMAGELEKCKQKESDLADLPEKYEALLQMYGELVEKNDELRLDLEEARTAYRAQLQDLTSRLRKSNV